MIAGGAGHAPNAGQVISRLSHFLQLTEVPQHVHPGIDHVLSKVLQVGLMPAAHRQQASSSHRPLSP